MNWLLLLLVPFLHKVLLRAIPYRWVINSIIYPINKIIISLEYNKMSHEQRIENWSKFEIMDHWSMPYWFNRAIKKHILLKYLSKGAE